MNTMKDVMIDLETLGTCAGNVILSIGAVQFNAYKQSYGRQFHEHIELRSSMTRGYTVDPSTLKWWLAQSEEARTALLDGQDDSLSLYTALIDLATFLREVDPERVWSWGINMDIAMLSEAYDRADLPRPWKYDTVRDARSVFLELSELMPFACLSRVNPTLKHDAVSDAWAQAMTICGAYATVLAR